MSQTPQERHQRAYQHLDGLLSEADDALTLDRVNEEGLREAFQAAEDLLTDLDDVEYNLIRELEKAEEDIIGGS